MRRKVVASALALALAMGAPGAAFAESTPKAAKEAGRPGQILNEAECSKVWSDASGGQDLSAEKAKPFVTNFEQVDKNGDNMISSAEFTDGCKMGFVQQAAAGSESSTGAGAGTEGAE